MIHLHPLFSDGAVLQRRKPLPVFGTAAPGTRLRLSFNGVTMISCADAQGGFLFRLPPMEAGGPFSMILTDCCTQEEAIVQNLLIGEVWLASGQSNMEYVFARSVEQAMEFRREEKGNDAVRIFTVPHRLSFSPAKEPGAGRWISAADKEMEEHSAVALRFALVLQKKLHLPVGILSAAWGGSVIEAWISRNSLVNDPVLGPELPFYDLAASEASRWSPAPENLLPPDLIPECGKRPLPENEGLKNGWAKEDFDDSSWPRMSFPGDWIAQSLSGSGSAWIRKSVTLPKSWAGKDLELFSGGIDKQDVAYFNGHEIGHTGQGWETKYWNMPRHYRVPGKLVHAGKNEIAFRVFSFFRGAGFGGTPKDYFLTFAGKSDGKRIRFSGEAAFHKECDWGIVPAGNEWYSMDGKKLLFYHHPSILFDSMIAPLLPYAVRGVLWYQGESNADAASAAFYRDRLAMLIRDWRFHLGQGEKLPFLLVQLANFHAAKEYGPEELWPLIRQAQWETARIVKECGIIAAHDIGDAEDLHPQDKRRVGERLALLALCQVYGCWDFPEPCPVPETMSRKGNTLRIRFRFAERGLVLEARKKSGFLIASSGKFYPAEARVEGGSVVLFSPRVASPCRVRYAWADNPAYASLYNRDGNPVIAFEMSC